MKQFYVVFTFKFVFSLFKLAGFGSCLFKG